MKIFIAILLAFFLVGCKDDITDTVEEIPEFVFAGGATTIFDATSNAYATPAPNLSDENFNLHLDGDLAFEQIFITAPAEVNSGLGPVFNNNSCVSCHVRNGRATPSLSGNDLSGFLLRISLPGQDEHGGPKPVPNFGTQLQTRSIYGQVQEANYSATELTSIIEFINGESVTLYKPEYTITETYQDLPEAVLISPRVAPSVFGLGLLEAIPEANILASEDINDSNQDGISGKANQVWDIEEQTHTLGRFGWKAEMPTAHQQTADAYHQDMGITSSFFNNESCEGQANCNDDDGEIDINDEVLEVTAFYFQSLAVPAVRNYEDEQVLRGQLVFNESQCNSCHTPKQVTGTAIITELSNQTIYPYTDLLLHDMGPGLSDNRPSFEANGNEWRTPPLWGIGLLPVVNGHTRLLHDGRARNITEAILWHGGEGEAAKQNFVNLSKSDRNALLAFLNAL